ncbi:MAG: hypothetical protein M3139_02385 [Bacteroidota bacterium]|nr:hypothetical protein [Bacteroidota bacterium]
MNINFQSAIPKDFSENSHVWIYQSNKIFSDKEAKEINDILQNFIREWKSHGTPVKGFAALLFGQFIVFMADEAASGIVGGCSTDTSVRLMKHIEKDFDVDLFDRQMLAFIIDKEVQLIPLSQVNNSLDDATITTNTLYFNNTILTKNELLNNWIIPVKKSWLAKRIARDNQAKS